MKNRKTTIVILIMVTLLLMIITRPTSNGFNKWLAKNYLVYCESRGNTCGRPDEENYPVSKEEPILLLHSEINNRFIYATFEKKFEEDLSGDVITIKALGILGVFIQLEEKYE